MTKKLPGAYKAEMYLYVKKLKAAKLRLDVMKIPWGSKRGKLLFKIGVRIILFQSGTRESNPTCLN